MSWSIQVVALLKFTQGFLGFFFLGTRPREADCDLHLVNVRDPHRVPFGRREPLSFGVGQWPLADRLQVPKRKRHRHRSKGKHQTEVNSGRRNEKYNFACLILGLIPWTISHFLFRKLCCNLLFSAELKPRGCYYSALKSAKMLKTKKFDSLSPMT